MARNKYGPGITTIGVPYGAVRVRSSDGDGDLGVRPHFTVRNRGESEPHVVLKFCASKVQVDGKCRSFSREVFGELRRCVGERAWRDRRRWRYVVVGHVDVGDAVGVTFNHPGADGRRNEYSRGVHALGLAEGRHERATFGRWTSEWCNETT